MKKGAPKQQQLYFSSSNEDNEEQEDHIPKQTYEKDYTAKEEEIDQLSSFQVLELFFDSEQFHGLLEKENRNPDLIRKFIWRTHFILGETILNVQKILVEEELIKDCLLLQHPQIEKAVYQIIEKAKKVPQGQDIQKMKTHIDQFYKHSDFDAPKMLVLYSEFVKLSRDIIRFQMELNFVSIQEEVRLRRNPPDRNMSIELNEQYSQNKISMYKAQSMSGSQIDNSVSFNNPPKLQASMVGQNGDRAISNNQTERPVNKKWSPTQQAIFCKIYSETDSPLVCAQQMEKQAGPDGRWKTANQIQDKMSSLAVKVFQKFESLTTNNEFIKAFKENKKVIFDCPQNIKKKIFRNIAIIYESMLNVSEQKKAVISQKILEVNRLCREAGLSK